MRRAAVAAEFDVAVPESDPFREPLSKIFYRKIKRSKKKATSGTGGKDGESEVSSQPPWARLLARARPSTQRELCHT